VFVLCTLHLIYSIGLSILLRTIMNIGDEITALRKAKKMSQADLAKAAGVSREIIGRYERNEVSPSVDVAKKIADTLEVSLDYLAGEGNKTGFDKQTLKLIDEIEELEPSIKDNLLFLANAIIRDAKTGKAYS
jgi:transcriptional regulator with XRE-family HTH domain